MTKRFIYLKFFCNIKSEIENGADIMADERKNHGQSSGEILISQLRVKDQYINDLAQAIDQHDDLQVYQLLEPVRYREEIDQGFDLKYGEHPFELVRDQRAELAHYLSDNLIDYLIQKFPFFYYREVEKGQFIVFFGNWWDRRQIGTLDSLNIELALDEDKLSQLEKALQAEEAGESLNGDQIAELSADNVRLQKLIDGQAELEKKKEELLQQQSDLAEKGGLFESAKVKEERQQLKDDLAKVEEEIQTANQAPSKIREQQKQILALSKEDTMLGLETAALKKSFTSFKEFHELTQSLYHNYLMDLLDEGQVKSNG